MPPPLLFDISGLPLAETHVDAAGIEAINPHRGAMRMLDGILWLDLEDPPRAVACKDVRDDEFWVLGHIPGRPLLPGVLMLEAAAQLASFMMLSKFPRLKFLGFTGVDQAKFRGQVVPGDRLLLLGQGLEFKPRRCICATQGLVGHNQVFEAKITGMPI